MRSLRATVCVCGDCCWCVGLPIWGHACERGGSGTTSKGGFVLAVTNVLQCTSSRVREKRRADNDPGICRTATLACADRVNVLCNKCDACTRCTVSVLAHPEERSFPHLCTVRRSRPSASAGVNKRTLCVRVARQETGVALRQAKQLTC